MIAFDSANKNPRGEGTLKLKPPADAGTDALVRKASILGKWCERR